MESEWIDARADGSDLRVGDRVCLQRKDGYLGRADTIIKATEQSLWLKLLPMLESSRDPSSLGNWKYHAPTRAKLVAEERAALFATETTYIIPSSTERAQQIGEAAQPAPPVAPPRADLPVEYVPAGTKYSLKSGDAFAVAGVRRWYTVDEGAGSGGYAWGTGDRWIQRAPPVAQPQPPADNEPGWDHVPAERQAIESAYTVERGDRWIPDGGTWSTATFRFRVAKASCDRWIRRASHPERVRWLEERSRVLNSPPSAAYVGEESTYARDDDARVVTIPVDPFAAVRAEAKRMMDNGADPRDVLGALDSMVRSHSTGASVPPAEILTWQVHGRAHFRVAQTAATRRESPCYHGNRAGSCGWCALVHERSDSRAVASCEPAWETADCEGE